MRADAERRHHAFNFRHQRLNGGVVEMVVVIVGDNQQIDLRHPLRVPRVITGESLIDERERRGVTLNTGSIRYVYPPAADTTDE